MPMRLARVRRRIGLVVFGAALLSLGATRAKAWAGSGFFAGQLPDGRAVFLTLQRQDTAPKGTLLLEGEPAPWWLQVTTPQGSVATMTCRPSGSGSNSVTLTSVTLDLSAAPWIVQARLRLGSGTNPITFAMTNVAAADQHQRKRGVRAAGRGGGKQYHASWPRFIGHSPLLQAVSAQLAREAKAEAEQFLAGAWGVAWQGLRDGGRSWSWERLDHVHVAWLSAHALSLYQETWEFTGGAHGVTTVAGRNFWWLQGQARPIGLADLFRAGSGWESALSGLCLQRLHRLGADWVVASRIKELAPQTMAAFTFDRRGLSIHFQQYEVAPGAAGVFHVFVPWSELGPYLDRAGPVRLIPGALRPD